MNIIIFANEETKDNKDNPKGLTRIGNIPLLYSIISSFKKLKDDYHFKFIVICHKDEKETIEDEMERWDKDIIYLSTSCRDMDHSIFYHYLNSDFKQVCNKYIITSLYFPLLSDCLLKDFIEKYKGDPQIMIGDFSHSNISYGKLLLPKLFLREKKGVFHNNGNYNFMYLTIISDSDFKQIFSINTLYKVPYYHCIYFNTYILPNYYSYYESVPFFKENDLEYINYLYNQNEKKDLLIQMEKLWKRWKNIEERIKKLE